MGLPDRAELHALRSSVIIYLEHLAGLLRARDQPFLPYPLPDDPTGLPPYFPDGDCVHKTYINLGRSKSSYQEFEVTLRHFDPAPGDPFLSWEILIRRRGTHIHYQLGYLEVDRVLYYNQAPISFSGSFILNELKKSVELEIPIQIIRALYPAPPTLGVPRGAVAEIVQVVDKRHRRLLVELSRRYIPSHSTW